MSKQTWHPYTEPPDNMRQVMLRFDTNGERDRQGFYSHVIGAYAGSPTSIMRLRFLHPTHWRELTEEEK